MKYLCHLLILISFPVALHAQQETGRYPIVGKPCPAFVLHHVKYAAFTERSSTELKGKWLALDFFTSTCGACFASLPEVSAEAKALQGQMNYIMVGMPDNHIGPLYERYVNRLHMIMPCAFDSTLFKHWAISVPPRIVVIDPQGIVRFIGSVLSENQLRELINDNEQQTTNLVTASPDGVILYGSAFSAYQPKQEQLTDPVCSHKNGLAQLDLKGFDLTRIINYAFWGDMSPSGRHGIDSAYLVYADKPIIQTRDSDLFRYSYQENQNIFDFTLKQGRDTDEAGLRAKMREDICDYFGWNVSIVNKSTACWKLVAKPGAAERLATKGGEPFSKGKMGMMLNISVGNYPFNSIFQAICGRFRNQVIIDSTGITGNIDVSITGPLLTIEDANNALKAYGLQLVPSYHQLKALIVKDEAQPDRKNWPVGVKFETGNWQEVIAKAHTEHKHILVYCSSPGSDDCKKMETQVFPAALAGDYLSRKFIVVKYDIASKDTGVHQFMERYHIRTAPAFVFLTEDGTAQHIMATDRRNVQQLIDLAAQSFNPQFQFFGKVHRFEQGQRDSVFLYSLAEEAYQDGQPVSDRVFHAYFDRYIMQQGKKANWSKDNCGLLEHQLYFNTDTAIAKLLYDNRVVIDQFNHNIPTAEIGIKEYIFNRFIMDVDQSEPGWVAIGKLFDERYPAIDYKQELLKKQIEWYADHNRWHDYAQYAALFTAQYKDQLNWNKLNDFAFNIFLHDDDPSDLAQGIVWAKQARQMSNDRPDVLDTLAELLYKTKSKEDYLSLEQQALEADSNDKGLQATYDKMKKGLRTWQE